MITSITVKDYKEFKYLKLNNLKSINIIIGKNGIGKTNLLKALNNSEDIENKYFFDEKIIFSHCTELNISYLDQFIKITSNLDIKNIENYLKLVYPKLNLTLEDIYRYLSNNILHLLPSGYRKLLSILCYFCSVENGSYLLIDDIDEEFYTSFIYDEEVGIKIDYTIMHNVWKVIIDLIIKKDIYIFCTINNKYFIKSLLCENGLPCSHRELYYRDECECKYCKYNEKFRWNHQDLISIYRLQKHPYPKERLKEIFGDEKESYPIRPINIDFGFEFPFEAFDWEKYINEMPYGEEI